MKQRMIFNLFRTSSTSTCFVSINWDWFLCKYVLTQTLPFLLIYMGVSKNSGIPKLMVYDEHPIKMDDLGVPLFSETSIYVHSFPSLICRSAPLVKSISMILISPVNAAWCKAVRPRESFKETKVVPPIQTIQAGNTKFRWFMANIRRCLKFLFEGGIRARTKGLDTQRKSSSSMKRNLVKNRFNWRTSLLNHICWSTVLCPGWYVEIMRMCFSFPLS